MLIPEQREVVQLKYYSTLSYKEIAVICRISEKLIKSRLFEARKKIKELLPNLVNSLDYPLEEKLKTQESIMKSEEIISKGAYVLERLSLEKQIELCSFVKEQKKFDIPLLESISKIKNGKEFITAFDAVLQLSDLVSILNYTDRCTEIRIIEKLDIIDPDFSETIKQNMFVFEDLVLFDSAALKKLHNRIDSRLLKKALFGVTSTVRKHILSVLTKSEQEQWEKELYKLDISPETVNRYQYDIIAEIKMMEQEGLINAERVEENGIPRVKIK